MTETLTQKMEKQNLFVKFHNELAKELDVYAVVIYGQMEYYARMNSGMCFAKEETIAENLGISVKTVERKIKILESEGLVKDHDPELRNHSHAYEVIDFTRSKSLTKKIFAQTPSPVAKTPSPSTTTESLTDYDSESYEKKESLKESLIEIQNNSLNNLEDNQSESKDNLTLESESNLPLESKSSITLKQDAATTCHDIVTNTPIVKKKHEFKKISGVLYSDIPRIILAEDRYETLEEEINRLSLEEKGNENELD